MILDKEKAKIQKQLFIPKADFVAILWDDVPQIQNMSVIPDPGKAQALTVSEDSKHVLSFDNGMNAVLAEKTYSSFKAFSLAELMEFNQVVRWLGASQPPDQQERAQSVVDGVAVIADNAIRVHASLRDTGQLGEHGQVLKAYIYLQIYYLIMFREVFDNGLAEMFLMQSAKDFALKTAGCPGMGPARSVSSSRSKGSNPEVNANRCLFCGKSGHHATSGVHASQLAEGNVSYSQSQLQQALSVISNDSAMSNDQKRTWMTRIKAYFAKMGNDAHTAASAAL